MMALYGQQKRGFKKIADFRHLSHKFESSVSKSLNHIKNGLRRSTHKKAREDRAVTFLQQAEKNAVISDISAAHRPHARCQSGNFA